MMGLSFNLNNMNRIGTLILVSLFFAFVGCQKDEVELEAVIQSFGDDKVHLDANNYALFDDRDEIYINGDRKSITLQNGQATILQVTAASEYTAIYPYQQGGVVVLPKLQKYETVTVNGVAVQKITAPMAAKDGRVLHFKNLCSLLEVKVKAPVDNFIVHSITVTSPDKYLYGTYSVEWSGSTPSIAGPQQDPDHGAKVTLDCNKYTMANHDDVKTFYVVLPPFPSDQVSTLSVHVEGFEQRTAGATYSGTLYYHNTQMSESFHLPANRIIRGLNVVAYDTIHGLEGEGTSWNPYKLYNYRNLYYAAQVCNSGEVDNITSRSPQTFKTGTFWVMNNIDCCTNSVVPIGTQTNPFEGVFDGQNHTVNYNSLVDIDGNIGLLGNVANGVTVKDLTVSGDIVVNHANGRQVNVIGGVVGGIMWGEKTNTNATYITNCHNQANIVAPNQNDGIQNLTRGRSAHVGGVLGAVWQQTSTPGTVVYIENCTNSGNIDGFSTTQDKSGAGGILGSRIKGVPVVINNCKNSGQITGRASYSGEGSCGVGGIVGVLYDNVRYVKIVNCENTGLITNVSPSNAQEGLGGICGVWGFGGNDNIIANCVNHADVTHQISNTVGYAGGILGKGTVNLKVQNCYSDGIVSGCATDRMGGIAGQANSGVVSACYYSGNARTVGNRTNAAEIPNCGQIGNGDGQTSYSDLLGILNDWVAGSTATPAYSGWSIINTKPELNSLHGTTTGTSKRKR